MRKLENKHLITLLLSSLLTFNFASAQNNQALIKNGGRAPGKNLKIKKSKVPQYDLASAKNLWIKQGTKTLSFKEVPTLDIGLESTVSQSPNIINIPQLPNKKAILTVGGPIKMVTLPKGQKAPAKVIGMLQAQTKVTAPTAETTKLPTYPVVPPAMVKDPNPQEKVIKVFSESDIKLLQALIFLEIHENYELAMGLFSDLYQGTEYKNLANYNLGKVARKLKLQSEFERRMLTVLEKDPKLSRSAIEELAQYIRPTASELAEKIEPYVEKYELSSDLTGPWSIARSKGLMNDKKIEKALAIIEEIPEQNKFRIEGDYLKGLILYRGNKVVEAQELLEKDLKILEDTPYSYDLKSLVAMTLGRIYFQRGDYDKSFKTYLKVEKNHPLWLQSLIETAWSQILTKDFEGAAGNMFTLHTDFFKNAYQPESYMVRTVSYLNLCQYGDALAVLKQFSRKYNYVLSRVQTYQKSKKTDLEYYETVKSFLKHPEQREVDALPRSLIVEMARSPEFLMKQRAINELEDENQRYLQVSKTLLEQEKKILENIQKSKDKLAEAKSRLAKIKDKDKSAGIESEIKYFEGRIFAYETQHSVAKRARQSIKEIREKALAQSEAMEKDMRLQGSKILKSQLAKVEKNVTHLIEQADLLQYEIFSGAGEQIRYQMAGGEESKEVRPELKPEDKNAMKWGYKGEIWEDEVGHFRSSLKNVCPKEESKISSN